MIENPLIQAINTHGVWLLVLFIVFYEVFVVKSSEVALHLVLSVVAALVFSVVVKELFLVPRPFILDGEIPKAGLAPFSSLPSTHTAVAFALATAVTLHQKSLGVMLFTIAALFSIGRVLANVHYPLDIILGMLIGVLTSVIFNQIHVKFRKK